MGLGRRTEEQFPSCLPLIIPLGSTSTKGRCNYATSGPRPIFIRSIQSNPDAAAHPQGSREPSDQKAARLPGQAPSPGHSPEDARCANCRRADDCTEETLRRLLSVMDDLSRKLGLALGTDGWTHQGEAYEVADQFDEWRREMREALVEWSKGGDTGAVNDLHPATLHVLDKTWPEWRDWAKRQGLDNTHVTNTDDPEKLRWNLRIPHYILDSYLREMSGNAWKVLCYIARRTTFDPSHPHFGRCWLGYDEIKDWTGVKQPERQIKELEGLGLVKVVHVRRAGNGQIRTTNELTITWFQDFKKMGVDGYGNR